MEKFYTHFDSIDSTSGYAKANLATFSKKGVTIISADEQIASYGQKKRTWLAPKGEGLWVSFCFYKENADGFILTRHMAESLLTLLKKKGVVGRIKWPNDIFVGDKKIAGILTEIADNFVIMGVGLNVNMPISTLDKIDQPATSLLVETKKRTSTKELLTSLANIFSALGSGLIA